MFREITIGLCDLRRLVLTELDFAPNSEMNLFCDNIPAIDIFRIIFNMIRQNMWKLTIFHRIES